MTAKEACENSYKMNMELIKKCNELINNESSKGEYFANFKLPADNNEYVKKHENNLINYLRENGFKVSIHETHNDEWLVTGHYLWIRWEV